jgi:hypothetical protein
MVHHIFHKAKIKQGSEWKMKLFSLRILLVLSLLVGFGTGSSVGAESASVIPSTDITVGQWSGHDFTFLNLPADEQTAGYGIFTADQATQGFQGDRSVRLSYADHVGKQVEVTDIVPFAAGNSKQEYVVHLTVKDTGEKLLGRTEHGQLEGLVLTADLNNARQQFLGKTIYPKSRELAGFTADGQTAVPHIIGDPVTVVDVYSGNRSQEPIYLIVSVNGQKAVLPIAYSWTNLTSPAWTETPPWQDALFMEDPKISLGGSYDVWSQIEKGNVAEGMTKGQILLSWGKPVSREAQGSVWNYGPTKLSFAGDVLQSMATVSDEIIADNQ